MKKLKNIYEKIVENLNKILSIKEEDNEDKEKFEIECTNMLNMKIIYIII